MANWTSGGRSIVPAYAGSLRRGPDSTSAALAHRLISAREEYFPALWSCSAYQARISFLLISFSCLVFLPGALAQTSRLQPRLGVACRNERWRVHVEPVQVFDVLPIECQFCFYGCSHLVLRFGWLMLLLQCFFKGCQQVS